jgi:hypothetical protein
MCPDPSAEGSVEHVRGSETFSMPILPDGPTFALGVHYR